MTRHTPGRALDELIEHTFDTLPALALPAHPSYVASRNSSALDGAVRVMTTPTRKRRHKRSAILLDLANAMLPCLMFVGLVTYTAWADWWIR